jgi:hypothetical protein
MSISCKFLFTHSNSNDFGAIYTYVAKTDINYQNSKCSYFSILSRHKIGIGIFWCTDVTVSLNWCLYQTQ